MRTTKPLHLTILALFRCIIGHSLIIVSLMTVSVPAFAQEEVSEADQAIRIEKVIQLDTARLEELKSDLIRREAAFKEIIDDLANKEAELLQLQEQLAEAEASDDIDTVNLERGGRQCSSDMLTSVSKHGSPTMTSRKDQSIRRLISYDILPII